MERMGQWAKWDRGPKDRKMVSDTGRDGTGRDGTGQDGLGGWWG